MKNLLITIILWFAFGQIKAQSTCCSQWITSKTNGPLFGCINTRTNSIFENNVKYSDLVPGGSYYTINSVPKYADNNLITVPAGASYASYTFAPNQIYGYNGSYVKVYTVPYNLYPSYQNRVVVLDDACNLVCSWGNTYPIYFVPGDSPLFGSSCGTGLPLQNAVAINLTNTVTYCETTNTTDYYNFALQVKPFTSCQYVIGLRKFTYHGRTAFEITYQPVNPPPPSNLNACVYHTKYYYCDKTLIGESYCPGGVVGCINTIPSDINTSLAGASTLYTWTTPV